MDFIKRLKNEHEPLNGALITWYATKRFLRVCVCAGGTEERDAKMIHVWTLRLQWWRMPKVRCFKEAWARP